MYFVFIIFYFWSIVDGEWVLFVSCYYWDLYEDVVFGLVFKVVWF